MILDMDTTQTVDTFLIASGRVFKTLQFDAHHAPHIDYNSIAVTAREIGGAFAVSYAQDGAVTVTLYWTE